MARAAAWTPSRAASRACSAASAVDAAVLGARLGGAGGLQHGLAGLLDHPHLALGAHRDVADGGGDLADRAARLVGGGGHLLGRGADRAGARGHLADQHAELRAHVVVGLHPALGLGQHLVERLRQLAQLVLGADLDRGGDGLDLAVRSPSAIAWRPSPRPCRQWSLRLRRRVPSAATGRVTERVTSSARPIAARTAIASTISTVRRAWRRRPAAAATPRLGLPADLLLELVVVDVEAARRPGRPRRCRRCASRRAPRRRRPSPGARARSPWPAAAWNSRRPRSNSAKVRLASAPSRRWPSGVDGLVGLRVNASISLAVAVLGLQVAVLDVEVADDAVAAGEEVLADRDELLQPGDVAVGELLGVVVDAADAR